MGTRAKHIIWDWNGTLFDDVEPCIASINRMLRRRGLPETSADHYRSIFEFPVKSYYRKLGFPIDEEDWDAVAREFHRHYRELAETAALRQGIDHVLSALAERGHPMSVLSACEISILEDLLSRHGIRGFFRFVYGLDNLYASSKLEQGRALLAAIAEEPSDLVLIGDTSHDVEVAGALGCDCVLLAGGHQSVERLVSHTDRIVRDVSALPAMLA